MTATILITRIKFKYAHIKDLVNNIKNNTISKTDAKKDLNTLSKTKNAEIIKHKKCTPGHKELLLFNELLDIILTDKTLESQSQEDENKNENKKVENENEELKEAEKMRMRMKMRMEMKMKMRMKMMMMT